MLTLTLRLMDPRTLGDRIREARNAAHMTQGQLASRIGVSRSLISQWESGVVQEIGASSLWAAARALRVSLDWMLEGDGKAPAHAAATSPDEVQLLNALADLTSSQRAALLAEAERQAAHNRELLEEMKGR